MHPVLRTSCDRIAPNKMDRNNWFSLQYLGCRLSDFAEIRYVGELWIPRDLKVVKSTCVQNQDGGWPPNYNFAVHSMSSLRFGTEFYHATADTLQTFKVKFLKVKVTVRHNMPAVKSYKSEVDGLTDFQLGEIIGLSLCGEQHAKTYIKSLDQVEFI